MNDWQQAFWLTKFELKHSLKSFVLQIGILIFALFLFVPTVPNRFENSFGIDLFFLGLIFILFIQWGRPKAFQIQKTDSGLSVSHFLVNLNQLPIKKSIIIKSRFLNYFILTIPFFGLFLSSLYLLTPALRESISLGSYAVFLIIWLSYALFIGCSFPATEAGEKVFKSLILVLLISPFVLIIYYLSFTKIYKHGFVHWTMFVAIEHPFIATILSLLLAALGVNYWMRYMRRKMEMNDYIS